MKLHPIAVAFTALVSTAAFAGGNHAKQSQNDQGMQQQSQASDQSSTKGSSQQQASQSDETVKKAQEALAAQGQDPGAADGVMGPKTQAALTAFQKSKGIKESGQLDDKTLAALNIEQSASTGSSSAPSTSSDKSSSGGSSTSAGESSSNKPASDSSEQGKTK